MNKKFIVGIIVVSILVIGIIVVVKKPQQVQSNVSTSSESQTQKQFTMAEITQHNTRTSCYAVVRGNVYDLTAAIDTHPGGPDQIVSLCGTDGTSAFVGKHGGQSRPESDLAKLQIGVLAQ